MGVNNMEIKQCCLTKNDCYKSGRTINPVGIVVHSTGANNPNLRRYVQPDDGLLGKNPNNNDWNRGGLNVCVHAFIGKDKNGVVRVYQTLPWTYRPWGCGSGKFGSYNNSHIQFEICEDALTDKVYYQQVMQAAKELCAYLCKKYNIRASDIVSHHEAHLQGYASNHGDCDHWLAKHGDSMSEFRADVNKIINGESKKVEMIKMIVNGKEIDVRRILEEGTNYIAIRDIAKVFDCEVTAKGNIPVLVKK